MFMLDGGLSETRKAKGERGNVSERGSAEYLPYGKSLELRSNRPGFDIPTHCAAEVLGILPNTLGQGRKQRRPRKSKARVGVSRVLFLHVITRGEEESRVKKRVSEKLIMIRFKNSRRVTLDASLPRKRR